MENITSVLPAAVAFPCADRVTLAASHVPPFEGTGVSATGRSMAVLGRADGPTGAGAQGTRMSAGWLLAGSDQPYGRQRHMAIPSDPGTLTALTGTTDINPTKTNKTENDVVVDDIPGVRYWSPPV